MSANSSTQQGVIQANTTPMNVDQSQDASGANSMLFTATIFTQDLSQNANNGMSMQQARQSIAPTSQAMMSDLNPFLSGGMDLAHQQSSNDRMMAPPSSEADDKDTYKGKFSRMSQWKAQLPKREPHNYDKCQPTAHQTTIYNQMLAQQIEPSSSPTAQMYNANPYGNMTDVNHMSPIQTTTNNYNPNTTVNNALNLTNNQIYANKMLVNLQQQQQGNTQQQTMTMDQHENSYKSPQSPSYRSYHHSNQQPYKIPSQNPVYGSNRMMMRQPSPPHVGAPGNGLGKSMSFQIQQHPQANSASAMKESYRSNSLPINANMQLPKDLLTGGGGGDFAVPKYLNTSNSSAIVGGKGSNRVRSNSINLRHGQLMSVSTPLQSATSEPTLNVNASSALAQLLTNSSVTSLLSQKGHSVSSSAMSPPQPQQQQQIQHHQQPQRANSFTSSSLVQNSILMAVSSINNQQQTKQGPTSSSSGMYQTPTLSPDSAFQHEGNNHHEMSSSSMSPERCLSLSKFHPRESQRRVGHIHAEQKRRYNIKNGFDMLHQLIPQLQQNPSAKVIK